MSELPAGNSLDWIGAIAGNTRLHWAVFAGDRLAAVWDGPHLATLTPGQGAAAPLTRATQAAPEILRLAIAARVPFLLASVVATQTRRLRRAYPKLQEVTLAAVPLQNLYPTLGIDRALVLLGAGLRYGFPVLVVDGGTALTLAGADGDRALVGGAILPGLALQQAALAHQTSALPEISLPASIPPRWARETPNAIVSGILHGAIATIADFSRAWQQTHPQSALVLTGGDGPLLQSCLQQQQPELAAAYRLDPEVCWAGLLDTHII